MERDSGKEGPAALAEALEELLLLASQQPASLSACSRATSKSVSPTSVSATSVSPTSAGGAAAAAAAPETNVRGKQEETQVSAQGMKAPMKAVALPAVVGRGCREDGSHAPANLGPESERLQARRTQAEEVDAQQTQQLQQQLQQQDAGEQQQVHTLVA
jgi:hypothetical protein